MSEELLRVGIVGLGRSGWNIHAAGLADLTRLYRVTAVADPEPDRRLEAEQRFGCTAYTQPGELFADPDVDLVIVATPSHTHVDTALGALDAGKHVVVEKPIAGTTAEVDRLIERAEARNRVLMAFQNQRLDPSFLAVREVLDSGRDRRADPDPTDDPSLLPPGRLADPASDGRRRTRQYDGALPGPAADLGAGC
jgi:scyllo-inositol 2-dehydrogenase (NADP+)